LHRLFAARSPCCHAEGLAAHIRLCGKPASYYLIADAVGMARLGAASYPGRTILYDFYPFC
jgi:hypothetical protein